jgi:hypothetical protein
VTSPNRSAATPAGGRGADTTGQQASLNSSTAALREARDLDADSDLQDLLDASYTARCVRPTVGRRIERRRPGGRK